MRGQPVDVGDGAGPNARGKSEIAVGRRVACVRMDHVAWLFHQHPIDGSCHGMSFARGPSVQSSIRSHAGRLYNGGPLLNLTLDEFSQVLRRSPLWRDDIGADLL